MLNRRGASAPARFVQRWGWRAYATPILAIITVVALIVPSHAGSTRSATSATSATSAQAGRAGADEKTVAVEGYSPATADFAAAAAPPPAPAVIDLGSDAVSCEHNTYRRLVLVSISHQHLWACEHGKQVASSAVTTGSTKHHDRTPIGSWRVQAKQRDRYLVGPGYRDYVKYWIPFNGDFGLHDASWQTMPFGSADWPTDGSHGCVHLPTPTMAWMYHWATVGSTVVTVES